MNETTNETIKREVISATAEIIAMREYGPVIAVIDYASLIVQAYKLHDIAKDCNDEETLWFAIQEIIPETLNDLYNGLNEEIYSVIIETILNKAKVEAKA